MIDAWLRGQLLPWVSAPLFPYFLTGVTFLDELILEEFNWRTFSVIVDNAGTSRSVKQIAGALTWLVDLFDRRESQSAFPRMFSRFLMDPARAWSLWVNPRMYTTLAKQLLETLRDK